MTTEERRRRRFSESFRKEQVGLIESGKLSVKEVSLLYEVKPQNVLLWLKKYGSKELPGRIIVSSSKEYNRISELESEIKRLKEIIGDQQVKLVSQQALIDLTEAKLGMGLEKK